MGLARYIIVGSLALGVGCPGKALIDGETGVGEAADTDTETDTDTDTDTGDTGGVDTGPAIIDSDGDGIPFAEDCDDEDPGSTAIAHDRDCDGTVTGADCDDFDPSSTVVAIDADCDGTVTSADCDDSDARSTVMADDADCDGTLTAADCDDTDPDSPAVADDADCDGDPDASDCDDTDPTVHTGALDDCDGRDTDCNGSVDDDAAWWVVFVDVDDDGFGDGSVATCAELEGHAGVSGDCDDTDPAVHPDAVDDCDGVDSNCDGTVDDAAEFVTYFYDGDADGYGDTPLSFCAPPEGYVLTDGDCDDDDPAVHPDADDTCDGFDTDCDGEIDDDASWTVYFPDEDLDGFGAADGTPACGLTEGWVDNGSDCDDTDASVYPGAGDSYGDGADGDCDGLDCEAGSLDGNYFAACPVDIDQASAESQCVDAGYDGLASILSDTEQGYIESMMTAADFTSDGHWIGLTDHAAEGTWVWSDGSPTSYLNWHSSEPDPAEEDCVAISWTTYGGQWFDAPCTSVRDGLVCSRR